MARGAVETGVGEACWLMVLVEKKMGGFGFRMPVMPEQEQVYSLNCTVIIVGCQTFKRYDGTSKQTQFGQCTSIGRLWITQSMHFNAFFFTLLKKYSVPNFETMKNLSVMLHP